ncbi:MAG TPA: translation factor GTPase family protein [Nakamurella sp.]|nr:translation factor GTPase family protein [Nakamurella sp.]
MNLGILAHVDAGKTSLTERILHSAGVIDEIGSVDDGNTQTDSLALERQRGITIKSAVVSFVIGDTTVNLIDTPGHPDFIAEVERVLSVLDGAVLVISAVEGVQAQTRVLMRTLQRLRIPTLLFVNKIDRVGAQRESLLCNMSQWLAAGIVPMGATSGMGTRTASFRPYAEADADFHSRLLDLLTYRDEVLLTAFVNDDGAVPYRRLRRALAIQTGNALVHPVFFGSAITGAGVDALIADLTQLLPATEGDADQEVSGTAFKIERGAAGEKIAYVRLFAGTVRVRDRLPFHRPGGSAGHRDGDGDSAPHLAGKVTAICVFDHGTALPSPSVSAGQIGLLWGLADIRIGDMIGPRPVTSVAQQHFPPPSLETVVVPDRPADKGALRVALDQLAEQDPLINLRQDDLRQEISVSLYGEVQKEVIQATLAGDFGVDVTFRESTTICIERPLGTGVAVELIGVEPNPFLATVGLRIEPAPIGGGVEFRLEVELGSMPFAFFTAVEDAVRATLQQGIHGWQVTDCLVTMTHSGYAPKQSHSHGVFDKSMSSTGADFRDLTPLVVMAALQRAGTVVCEPMHRFRLDAPSDTFGALVAALARVQAIPRTSELHGPTYVLQGGVPASQVHALERGLPSLTRGEGVLETAFDHHRPVTGAVPSRPRSDHNPLDRKAYLLHVIRRV